MNVHNPILIISTDIWQTYSSFHTIGIAATVKDAIICARKDADAVDSVRRECGHIVMRQYEINTGNYIPIFCTADNRDRDLILNM